MVIQVLTGLIIIPGMTSFLEGLRIIGTIALLLTGAFPALYILTKLLKKPLAILGKKIRISSTAVAGLIATLANNIPMFGLFKEMDSRGKVMNVAFAVSASFLLGDHLAFTAAVNKGMILPVIIGKLVAGLTALLLAGVLYSKFSKKKK
jgi:ethanolamine transporter